MILSKKFDLSTLPHVAALLAPAVVALTGLLYIAGYTERRTRLNQFGLEGAFSEPSVQVVLAQGFPIILIGSIAVGLLLAFLWLAQKSINRSFFEDPKNRNNIERFKTIRLFYFRFSYAFFILSYGYLSGSVIGGISASRSISIVNSGCKVDCFFITTDLQTFKGNVIEQDSQKMALYTKNGIQIIDSKIIKRISPITDKNVSILNQLARRVWGRDLY